MTTIAGASRYLAASTLANTQGTSPSTPNILGEGSTASLLEAGRLSNDYGIGLSDTARQLTQDFLNSTSSAFNSIFSLSTAEMGTNETIQQKILALRASIPESQLSRELRGENVDEEA